MYSVFVYIIHNIDTNTNTCHHVMLLLHIIYIHYLHRLTLTLNHSNHNITRLILANGLAWLMRFVCHWLTAHHCRTVFPQRRLTSASSFSLICLSPVTSCSAAVIAQWNRFEFRNSMFLESAQQGNSRDAYLHQQHDLAWVRIRLTFTLSLTVLHF